MKDKNKVTRNGELGSLQNPTRAKNGTTETLDDYAPAAYGERTRTTFEIRVLASRNSLFGGTIKLRPKDKMQQD